MSIPADDLEHKRFDQWSETYESSYLQWLLFDRVHRAILKQIPVGFHPTAVLDLGCGTGRLLRRMQAAWPDAKFVGIDLSEGMVSKAHHFSPFAAIYQAPAEFLPLQSATLDLVTSSVTFHHWMDQEQGVCEAARVLRQGGIFILADPNIGHGHPRSRKELRDYFQSSGLKIMNQSSILPFFSVTSAVKL